MHKRSLVVSAVFAVALGTAPALAQNSSPAAPRAYAGPASPLAVLIGGLAERMDEAASALQTSGQRRQATQALDEARRLSRVLQDVTPAQERFAQGLDGVRVARHELQNGRPASAVEALRRSSEKLRALRAFADALPAPELSEVGTADLRGKTLINARGEKIGEFRRLIKRGDDQSLAVVEVGGVTDLFGFLDLGTRQVALPASEMLAGRRAVAIAANIEQVQLAELPRYEEDQ